MVRAAVLEAVVEARRDLERRGCVCLVGCASLSITHSYVGKFLGLVGALESGCWARLDIVRLVSLS